MQLKQVGEFRLIDIITRQTARYHPSVIQAIGDDSAVVKMDIKECLLITTDILKEGIHFQQEYTSPYLLGKKCISINLSDIAAMGGTPLYYLVSLIVPASTPSEFVKKLYRGMNTQAKNFKISLLGGDTIASQDGISIAITLLGKAAKNHVIYRRGARKRDLVCVTGFIGDSALGLLMLEKKHFKFNRNSLIRKHLDPIPRIEEAKKISRLRIASSMIDISDGLISDLRHILSQSKVGARIQLSSLPLSRQYKKYCSDLSQEFYQPALSGGEDYELIFTMNPRNRLKLEKLFKKLSTPVTCIGEITENPEELIVLDKNGRHISIEKEGYTHF